MHLSTIERQMLHGLVLILAALAASVALAQEKQMSLPDAVREALAANLDLAAQGQQLAAARQEIDLAQSRLLPQLGIGAEAALFGEERAESLGGDEVDRSVLVGAQLNQVLYDEEAWAGFTIQKHVYESQAQAFEASRLAVIQQAAGVFLELDRARRVLEIQERNREFTQENLETSRSRIAAGWSSEREILRWETELAGNDRDVRRAQVGVLSNLFALNRVRNRPLESKVSTAPATIDEYGFVYAREEIAKAIVDPDNDRRMRDALVRVGLQRSPELAALDASIAAAERQLTATRRAFYVPSLNLQAGVDHVKNRGTGDASDFSQTEWSVRGTFFLPLVQGGARLAARSQARSALSGVRTERRATALSVEESIRSALAQASGSFESVGFAERQVEAARRNFELVEAAYTLGVASILDLLDAQEQLLSAELGLSNAIYFFLGDLIAAEASLSFYAFLEEPATVDAVVDPLVRQLARQP
jgi:outer membrane protein TolC